MCTQFRKCSQPYQEQSGFEKNDLGVELLETSKDVLNYVI